MSTLPEDPRSVLDDLKRAAAAKWKGDQAAQQWGLFARAAAEIERLQATLKLQQASYERELALDAATAEEEIERLQADAARYRWLRGRVPGGTYRVMGIIYSEGGAGVDAGIDAAIAASQAEDHTQVTR